MSTTQKVLAPSATMLTVSSSEENWFAALPVLIAKFAGTDYEHDNSTMRLEKVCLNKQTLRDRVRFNFRATFAAIYGKDGQAEKDIRLPDDVFNRLNKAVDTFIDEQLQRLIAGKWEITTLNRSFAYSTKHSAYVESMSIKSELLIDANRQLLAASIYKSECERKLTDLEKKQIADDDIRIVNARKRVVVATERYMAANNAVKKANEAAAIAQKPA